VVEPSQIPARTGGYAFAGWATESPAGSLYTFSTAVTGNKTLYAKWTVVTYTVTLECMNDEYSEVGSLTQSAQRVTVAGISWNTLIPDQTVEGGRPFAAGNVPSRAGYTFDKWYTDMLFQTEWDMGVGRVTEDMTLYGKWTANIYTVTFDDGVETGQADSITGMPSPDTQTILHLNRAARPETDPMRSGGYAFAGWGVQASADNYDLYDFATLLTGNKTLYAKWTPVTYTVTLECMNDEYNQEGSLDRAAQTVVVTGISWDTIIPPQTVTGAQTFISGSNTPSRAGYTFDEWNTALGVGGQPWDMGVGKVTSNMTLYAKWQANVYTVSFDANGEAGADNIPDDQTVLHLHRVQVPTQSPMAPGKTFLGWHTDIEGTIPYNFTTMITEDRTLYAKWGMPDATITLDFQDGITSNTAILCMRNQIVPQQSSLGAGNIPLRTGYAFGGWWTAVSEGTIWNMGSTQVTGNQTLYARWTAVGSGGGMNTVSFSAGAVEGVTGLPASQAVANGGLAVPPASNPVRTGYVFMGWTTGSVVGPAYNWMTTLTSDLTLYASWIADSLSNATVTLVFQDGSTPNMVIPSAAGSILPQQPGLGAGNVPSRQGYTFTGWWTEAVSGGSQWLMASAASPAGSTTLYARWTPGGGSASVYTVSFTSGAEGVSNLPLMQTVVHGGAAIQPSQIPLRSGYFFTGWAFGSSSGPSYNWAGAVTSNIVLYAKWTAADATVILDFQDSQTASLPITCMTGGPVPQQSSLGAGNIPSRTGYVFTGWWTTATTGGTLWNMASTPVTTTGTTTLYARWSAGDGTTQYTVIFNQGTGDTVTNMPAGQIIAHNSAAMLPSGIPARTGYNFLGWGTSPDEGVTALYTFSTPVTSSITLYAKWAAHVPQTVTLKFNDTVTPDKTADCIVGQIIPQQDGLGNWNEPPERAGYNFSGWWTTALAGGTRWNMANDTVSAGLINLYARWSPVSYTVTFSAGGVSDVSGIPQDQTVFRDQAVVEPSQIPVRTGGYAFAGWATESPAGSLYTFSTAVTGNLTLYAKWNVVTYTVTLEYMNDEYLETGALDRAAQVATVSNISWGATIAHQNVTGQSVSSSPAPNTPTRAGHTFEGWYTAVMGGALWDMAVNTVTANQTLYARWTAHSYTINFNAGSSPGSVTGMPDGAGNPQSVRYLNRAGRPSDPAWNTGAYTFAGWSEDVSEGSYTLYNFNTLVTSNKTLYAKWNAVTYTVTLECMNDEYSSSGSLSKNAQTITVTGIGYNQVILQQAGLGTGNVPVKAGWNFAGWRTSLAVGAEDWTMDTGVTADRTLYAWWTLGSHTVTFSPGTGVLDAGDMPLPQTVPHLSRAVLPSVEPWRPANSFEGWYKEADYTTPFNFNDLITQNTTIYAKWHTTLLKTVTLINPHTMETIVKRVDIGVTYTPSDDNTLMSKLNDEWEVAGWYLPGEEYTTITSIQVNEDVTLRARTQPHTVKYWVPQVTGTTPMLYILPRVMEIDADLLSRSTVNYGYFTSWPSGAWGQVMAISPYPANDNDKYFTTQVEHGALAPQFLIWTAATGGAFAGDIYFRAEGGTPNNGRKDWRTVSQSGAEFSFNTARITADTELYLPDSQ
jgi:uncharacterized repeat protein (TIGR02543 family)